ncbi:MAG: putative GTP-binding protein EngB [Methanosaeta sp. PtaB.Bin039]|nr:MAG: putative GTP-binding protein EngB [Methanosaeta sp. PtaB.Bin039]
MNREIVLTGRSNVGKSTLFRALTGRAVPVGRRPGLTLRPFSAQVGHLIYVDLPGYGFMKYRTKGEQEATRDLVVKFLEDHQDRMLLAIQVIDAASFLEIASRWEERGEVPIEVELWEFLQDMDLQPVLAANKMDRIANPDETLDWIGERLGMLPPWRQWSDRMAPISAKQGDISALRRIIQERSRAAAIK